MRILLVIPTVFGGGAEQVAASLSQAWSRAHDVRVLAWQAPGESLDFGVPVRFAGLGVQVGGWGKLRNVWRRVQRVRRERREHGAQVVMAFMDEAGLPAVAACALDGALGTLVVSVHHNPQWMPRWRRGLLMLCYRWPARVVAVSAGVRQALVQQLHLPAGRVTNIPNPLVQGAVPEAASQALAAALPAGFVLVVGRLDVHTKGLDVLLAAYAALQGERPALVVLGDGAGRAWLMAEVARLGLSDSVHWMGWVREPAPFYARARVLVSASRFEGWSNVLMEAMGAACPVIASRCPHGPAEILGEDFARYLLPPGDVAALRTALQEMMAMPEAARVALGLAMRERVQRFDVSVVAPAWIALAEALPRVGVQAGGRV